MTIMTKKKQSYSAYVKENGGIYNALAMYGLKPDFEGFEEHRAIFDAMQQYENQNE